MGRGGREGVGTGLAARRQVRGRPAALRQHKDSTEGPLSLCCGAGLLSTALRCLIWEGGEWKGGRVSFGMPDERTERRVPHTQSEGSHSHWH